MFWASIRTARARGLARTGRGGLDGRTNPRGASIAARVCRDDRILHVGRRRPRHRISRRRLARGVRAAFGVTKNLGQESQRRVPLPEVSASRSPVAVSEHRAMFRALEAELVAPTAARRSQRTSYQIGVADVERRFGSHSHRSFPLARGRPTPVFSAGSRAPRPELTTLLGAASNANAVARSGARAFSKSGIFQLESNRPSDLPSNHEWARVLACRGLTARARFATRFTLDVHPGHAPWAGRSRFHAMLDDRRPSLDPLRDRTGGFVAPAGPVGPTRPPFFSSRQNREGFAHGKCRCHRRLRPRADARAGRCRTRGLWRRVDERGLRFVSSEQESSPRVGGSPSAAPM